MSGMVKLALVGCTRYAYKGAQYTQGIHYWIKGDRAELLLRLTTDHGRKVFREIGKPFQPVIEQVEIKENLDAPVVDTTKSPEEQFQDQLDANAGKVAAVIEADTPVAEDPGAEKAPAEDDVDLSKVDLDSEFPTEPEKGGTEV